jgi:hypothetical protein
MDPVSEERGRTPPARGILPIVPIVALVAWSVRFLETDPWIETRTWVAIAVAAALLIGSPALFWALDHGRDRLTTLIPLGAVAGMLPLLLISSSGAIGLTVRGGFETVAYALERGVPIPGMGVMPWPSFARTEALAALVGASSAIVYGLIAPAWKVRRPAS